MATKVFTARVDEDVLQQTKALAKYNGLSLSAIVNVKLREFIREKQLHLSSKEDFEVDFWPEWVDASEVLDFLKTTV